MLVLNGGHVRPDEGNKAADGTGEGSVDNVRDGSLDRTALAIIQRQSSNLANIQKRKNLQTAISERNLHISQNLPREEYRKEHSMERHQKSTENGRNGPESGQ